MEEGETGYISLPPTKKGSRKKPGNDGTRPKQKKQMGLGGGSLDLMEGYLRDPTKKFNHGNVGGTGGPDKNHGHNVQQGGLQGVAEGNAKRDCLNHEKNARPALGYSRMKNTVWGSG